MGAYALQQRLRNHKNIKDRDLIRILQYVDKKESEEVTEHPKKTLREIFARKPKETEDTTENTDDVTEEPADVGVDS